MIEGTKWEKIRWKIIDWIRWKVKVPKDGHSPKWMRVTIYYVLFPLRSSYFRQSQIKYDDLRNGYIIEGVFISRKFIENARVMQDTLNRNF